MWHAWYVTLKVSVYIEAFWVIIQYNWAGRCQFLWQIYCCYLQSVRHGKTTTGIFTAVKISKCTPTISLVERVKGLLVPVLNYVPYHEGVFRDSAIAPCSLYVGDGWNKMVSFTCWPLHSQEQILPSTQWVWGWMPALHWVGYGGKVENFCP